MLETNNDGKFTFIGCSQMLLEEVLQSFSPRLVVYMLWSVIFCSHVQVLWVSFFFFFFFKENNAFRKSSAVRDHCVLVFVLCCRCTNVFMGSHFKCSARFRCQSFHLHSLETLKSLSFPVLIKHASCVIKQAHVWRKNHRKVKQERDGDNKLNVAPVLGKAELTGSTNWRAQNENLINFIPSST